MSTPTADIGAPWAGDAPIVVQVHLYERTALRCTVHLAESRVVLRVEGANQASVHLFAARADLARLIDTASSALAELDASTVADSAA